MDKETNQREELRDVCGEQDSKQDIQTCDGAARSMQVLLFAFVIRDINIDPTFLLCKLEICEILQQNHPTEVRTAVALSGAGQSFRLSSVKR